MSLPNASAGRRPPAVIVISAVGLLVALGMLVALVQLWRYAAASESGTAFIMYIFCAMASLLFVLILVMGGLGAMMTWQGRPSGPSTVGVLNGFAGLGCLVMLGNGLASRVTDAPDTPWLAIGIFAAGLVVVAAVRRTIRSAPVQRWTGAERDAVTTGRSRP